MQLLKESISKRLTMSDRMALDDIANEVSNRYKNEFREELARTMYLRLPSSIDVNMRRRISEMDIQGLTLEGFLSRVKQLAKEQIASESKVRLKDFAGLAFAELLIIFATASGIVTGGSWRNLLGL